MDDRLPLSARLLTSQQFLPASAKKVRVKILHRDASTNHRRCWQVLARVASTQDAQARCEFVRETARKWRAQEEKARHAELRPPPEMCRPRVPRRTRGAVRGRPAIPPCNFRAESFRRLAG